MLTTSSHPALQAPIPPILVFTDLDGTLLDHDSYGFEAALPALTALKARNIPVVLNTSKTAAELLPLRQELDLHDPFIVENGAAIISDQAAPISPYLEQSNPNARVQQIAADYPPSLVLPQCDHSPVPWLRQQKSQFEFIGFSDMSVAEVADVTGLSAEKALQAKNRLFSEPLIWHDDMEALDQFRQRAATQGFRLVKGGRFWHLMAKSDKGLAMEKLSTVYQTIWQTQPVNIALGDGENDVAMLNKADYPVLVTNPAHSTPHVPETTTIITTRKHGPAGWNETILALLEQLTPD
ncbi:MAG: HAD-IIB family hydrolase [Pseudomonadales bacterium]|nr:HAD-IIB family hydrolase [Pseudomonadales bacterium]